MDWRQLILGRDQVPKLTHDSVHVWRVSTADSGQDLTHISENLLPEEIERAARFHFDKDRRSFVISRATLRRLLGEYTGAEPTAIRFSCSPYGKPALADSPISNLHFNISHSGDLALLAFSLGREVGVDVERIREDVDFVGLAKSSFSSSEREAVLASSPATRAYLFYEYWSSKESCIKADGRGLSVPLDRFSVVAQPGSPQWRQVVAVGSDSLSPDMRIRILTAGEGYAAAVAAFGEEWKILQLCTVSGSHCS